MIECATEHHSKNLLKSKLLCNISINVTPHTTLNSSKGVVRSKDLEGVSEEDICENLSSQGITSRGLKYVGTMNLFRQILLSGPSVHLPFQILAHSCCAVHSKPITTHYGASNVKSLGMDKIHVVED